MYAAPEGVITHEAELAEPLAAAVYAVTDVARFKLGDIALVSGTGPIGLLIVKLLVRQGIIVAGTSDDCVRMELALKYDMYTTIAVDKEDLAALVQAESNGNIFDVRFEVAGMQALVRDCMENLPPPRHCVQFVKIYYCPWI